MTATTDAPRRTAAAVADPKARKFLREADPVLARVIDAHPDFHPRAWIDELPPFGTFGTLVFQVIGQQLSVSATRTTLARLQERFGGHMPSPAEVLAADPEELRASGMSTRKGATVRALAERFVDGRLSDKAFAGMTDDEIEAALTEVPGIGPWTAHGFLIFALDRPDVLLTGDLALRRATERAYGLDHLPTEDEMARRVWSDGDALIAEFAVHYTRLDGGEVTVPCCNVFRLREGLVAEYRSYIDATPVYS